MVRNNDRWSQLSMKKKADLFSIYTQNGYTSLEDIKKHYNSFAPGGPLNPYTNKPFTQEELDDIEAQGLTVEEAINNVQKIADRNQVIQRAENKAQIKQDNKRLERLQKAAKAATIIKDVVQIHPLTGWIADIYESVTKPREENYSEGLSLSGKLIEKINPAIRYTTNELKPKIKIKNLGFIGRLMSIPDTIEDIKQLQTDIAKPYNHFATGGPTEEGGWSEDSKKERLADYQSYNPVGGTGISQLFYGSNTANGEENEYWKAYLGLNHAVPPMNPNAKTSWDDKIEEEKKVNGELPSDFYGTTPRMDLNIQAIADTLNVGKIYRDYDKYKEKHPTLPPEWVIEEMYNTGKNILEHPNEWQQVDGDRTAVKSNPESYINETNPLGMLANFGMMWSPEDGALYMHDTYDFNKFGQMFVGKRPKEMKIRSKISFDPKKGSKLLRDDLAGYYNYPSPKTE